MFTRVPCRGDRPRAGRPAETGYDTTRGTPVAKIILVVDDEAVIRESLAELLADEGFEVLQGADGGAAYDVALKRPVDLVLSDVRMPEMDGIALLGELRK